MANFEGVMSIVTATLDSFKKMTEKSKKIKAADRIALSCIATGVVFLIFALIQIIITAADGINIATDNIMLIVIDLAVVVIAGFMALGRGGKSDAQKKKIKTGKLNE